MDTNSETKVANFVERKALYYLVPIVFLLIVKTEMSLVDVSRWIYYIVIIVPPTALILVSLNRHRDSLEPLLLWCGEMVIWFAIISFAVQPVTKYLMLEGVSEGAEAGVVLMMSCFILMVEFAILAFAIRTWIFFESFSKSAEKT